MANAPSVSMHGGAYALEGRERRWWWAVGAVGLGLSLAYALIPERYTVLRDFGFYNPVTTGSWIAVLVGVHRYRPAVPLAWTLIGLGLLAWSVGDIVWSGYDAAGADVPYPSVADGFYVVGYPLIAAGLIVAIRARRTEYESRIVLDAAALTAATLLVVYVYIMRPVLDQTGEGWASKLFSILYPTGDLILVGTTALLFLGSSWRTPAMQLLLAGLAATFGADMAYYATPSAHGLALGDTVYLLALTCLALAGLHPSMRALTNPEEETAEVDSRKKLALLGGVLAVPPIVLLVQEWRGAPLYLHGVITAFLVLIGIVVVRLDRMLADARRMAATGIALSRFSGRLLGARDDTEAVAAADLVLDEVVRGQAGVVAPPGHEGTAHAVVASVDVEGVPVAEIVADARPRDVGLVQDRVDSIASQLSLALEHIRSLDREHGLVESLREQNERLAELDRMKNRFVSSTSHELRTPLTSMVGYLELLLGGEAGELNEDQRHFLEIVSRNCDRLNRLVDDVLFVGRADSDRLVLQASDVDVAELARAQVESQQAAARAKGLHLRLEAEDGLPEITGDATRLTQVLDNLLTNAIKFTPSGGIVAVAVSADDDHVRLSVSDTGVGIPADELPRIFERFFRASTAAAVSGTGLGLPIVRTIAEAHGGEVSVESEIDRGTTFSVELPLHPADDTLIMRATREKEEART